MKALVLVALLAAGCASLPRERAILKPHVWLRVGGASQVCAGRNGLASITLFANIYNLSPREARFVLNDGAKELVLFGKDFTVNLDAVGIGAHSAEVFVEGAVPVRITWSVWEC